MSIHPKSPIIGRTANYTVDLSTANDDQEKAAERRLDSAIKADWHLSFGAEPDVVLRLKVLRLSTEDDKRLAKGFREIRAWVDENKRDDQPPPTWDAIAEELKRAER